MAVERWLEPSLEIGTVANIEPWRVKVNLQSAGRNCSTFFEGKRYGLGEVGEFVLIESESNAILGRILECRLPERERLSVESDAGDKVEVHPIGIVQLLGSYDQLTEKLKAGVRQYPRLGARVFSAPHEFLSRIPMKLECGTKEVCLNLGHIKGASEAAIEVTPERLFGRHCAVLGATGGGKSYTVARIVSECAKHKAKVILLDATGEYRNFGGDETCHAEIKGNQPQESENTFCLPYSQLNESDFFALFQPTGKTHGPKLRSAIRSLRMVHLKPLLGNANGLLEKVKRPKAEIMKFEQSEEGQKINDPTCPFDVKKLAQQIQCECVEPDGYNDPSTWGRYSEQEYGWCLPLVVRINHIRYSNELKCVFSEGNSILDRFSTFLAGNQSIIRVSLEYLSFQFNTREIVGNAIGRWLLDQARQYCFKQQPILVVLDEAHQFLNKHIGSEESVVHLDAFELLAKEGRKYGLNICLATQRPRDLPEDILSQMGTLLVHRLTNDRDREIVERACGEIDRSASHFLPSLEPGEAAIIGADFPIPLTIQIDPPPYPPESTGPDYQGYWSSACNPVQTDALPDLPDPALTAQSDEDF